MLTSVKAAWLWLLLEWEGWNPMVWCAKKPPVRIHFIHGISFEAECSMAGRLVVTPAKVVRLLLANSIYYKCIRQ